MCRRAASAHVRLFWLGLSAFPALRVLTLFGCGWLGSGVRFRRPVGNSTYPHTPIDGYKPRDEHFGEKLAGLGFPEQRLTQERNGTTRLYQDNAEYAAVIAAMDENVGAVLRALAERKLDDNTIVVFTSDNGGLSTLQNKAGGPT